jgi:predicted O-methyltransferase YrrM
MSAALPMADHLATWARKSGQVSPIRIPRLNRKRLVQLFGEWGLRRGAEIGVDGGTFADYMFKVIPDLELIGVDPWARDQGKRQQAWKTLKEQAWKRMHMTSEEAAPQIPDASLDFVYIDGDHRFDFVMLDLILWDRKVKPGGMVAGHDYYRFRNGGVVPAVDAFSRQHGIRHWFLTDERTPSFFWIKR